MIKRLSNFIYSGCSAFSAFIKAEMRKPIAPYTLTHEEWEAMQQDAWPKSEWSFHYVPAPPTSGAFS
jgi:hypothetical protein